MSPDATVACGLIRARGIDKRFDGRIVLAAIDAAIAPGEIMTLIGPNGSGKTTLLRILLGLIAPDRGEVWRKPGLRIGYMPQRIAIDDLLPLTVRRFLELGRAVDRPAIVSALDEVGARHVTDSPIQAISGGELRRVLLARALLREPELLVLDEPVQGVDVVGQGELYRLIVSIRNRRGCGVLMVSHDLHLVMAATDTVLCLNKHVCCSGRPEAVSQHPEYLALFGPQHADSLALYTHKHDHIHDVEGRVVQLPDAEARGHDNHAHPTTPGDGHG